MAEVTLKILSSLSALGGLSAVIVSLLYYRENRRRKKAKTKAIDIESLVTTIEVLQKDKLAMHEDIQSMRAEIDVLKRSLRISDAEKIGIEKDLNIYKRAFGCRVECDRTACPIALRFELLTIKQETKVDG